MPGVIQMEATIMLIKIQQIFKNMNPGAVRLADKEEREKYVKETVKAFEGYLLKYLL